MIRFVLDASVALRWLLDKPLPAYAGRVRRFMAGGARAVVPALWNLEMASGLMVAERRGALTHSEVDEALIEIDRLLAMSIEVESGLVPAKRALATARAFRLSVYDGVYLDLARREHLPMATLDEQLRASAAGAGIEIL